MNTLIWLLRLFKPYLGWMLAGLLLSFFTLLANVGLMAMSGWFIASMAVAGLAGVSMNYFTPAAIIRFCAIVRTAGRYGERLITHEATFRLLAELRVWFYSRLEPLAPARLEAYHSGDLLSRIRADIDTLDNFYLRLLLPLAVALLASLAFILFLAWFDPLLALIEAVMLLLAGVVLPYITSIQVNTAGQRITEKSAELRANLITDLQGMSELLIDGAGQRHAQQVERLSLEIASEQKHMARLSGISQGFIGLSANLAMWLITLSAIPMITTGEIPPVQLSMLALFTLASFEAVAPLPLAFQSMNETLTAAKRVRAIVEAEPLVMEPESETPLSPHPAISFRETSLQYQPEQPPALERIDLELQPGSRIALVGPTGSGKSSVLNLLLKFHPASTGEIRIDGMPIEQLHGESIRERIAVLSQQTHLFNTSIRENLLFARPDACQGQLEQVCRLAEIHEFIQAQPEDYETIVGETGVRLSGGQARRIAIARALLKDAPILAMDEPTEGLDPETARRVMQNILNWLGERSLLLITHRLQGLENLHEILMIEQGRISERGSLEALLQQRGRFHSLYHENRLLDG